MPIPHSTTSTHVPALQLKDLDPFVGGAGVISTSLAAEVEHRMGHAIILGISEDAQHGTQQFFRRNGVQAAFEDAAAAACGGISTPPPTLVALLSNPTLAQHIQDLLVAASSSALLSEQSQKIKAAIQIFSASPACIALQGSFGTLFGEDLVIALSGQDPLKGVIAHVAAKLPPAHLPQLSNWTIAQARLVAEKEFSVGLERSLTESLTQGLSVDPFAVSTTAPKWYKDVKLSRIMESAVAQTKSGESDHGMPAHLAPDVTTERDALRNRVITATVFGGIGLVSWALSAGSDVALGASYVASGLAVFSSFSRSTSNRFGSSFSLIDLYERWDNSKTNTCAGAIRGLAGVFHSIRGDGNKVSRADEKVLKAVYEAMCKIEDARKKSTGAVAGAADQKDAPIDKNQLAQLRRDLNEAGANLSAIPVMLVNTALPIAVSFPLWKPIVFAWLGW